MRLLVTGGAGFIGSALVCRAVRAGHEVLTVDKLTYAGGLEALAEAMAAPRHRFLRADIAQRQEMETAFDDFDPDVMLHLAAESHVDRSIDDPEIFVTTNVRGSFVLLEAALRHWSRLRGCAAAGGRISASSKSRPTKCSAASARAGRSMPVVRTPRIPHTPRARRPPIISRGRGIALTGFR